MRYSRGLTACLIGIAYGGYLIWKGVTGNIWRTRFTGDAVVPRWLYIVGGGLLVLLGVGWLAAASWLRRM
ncbi:MAG TPA: hypothetical protein VKV04_01435 [Verrucomicrobiae bacterium]|nr:hypothetical protein [Verrucomicrobiae bacterium]